MISNGLETKLQQLLNGILTTKRMNCPSCGGINTFSVTNLGSTILFYCFKASCKFRGRRTADIGVDTIKEEFKSTAKDIKPSLDLDQFLFIPEVTGQDRIKQYLQRNNCWEAYREGRADIRYEPYEDRVVFMIYSEDKPVSAIGRSLLKDGIPKWKRYGKESKPFICAKDIEVTSKTLIIVEDCCSACAASCYSDSVALLGTYLPAEYLKEILVYDNFILALDKDASKLAFTMHKELQCYKPTKILLLEEDLKACDAEKIRGLFNV